MCVFGDGMKYFDNFNSGCRAKLFGGGLFRGLCRYIMELEMVIFVEEDLFKSGEGGFNYSRKYQEE